VVNNLDDGGEFASEGAAADQDEAANLDQLPGSELNVDIGHREFLEDTKKVSALVLFLFSWIVAAAALTVDRVGMCRRVVVERVGLSKLTLRISDVPTQFSLSGPLAAGLGLAYVSTRIILGARLFRREAFLAFFFFSCKELCYCHDVSAGAK
jgi:hypothetical protein